MAREHGVLVLTSTTTTSPTRAVSHTLPSCSQMPSPPTDRREGRGSHMFPLSAFLIEGLSNVIT